MPKSRQTCVMASPSRRRATNRRRSSMTEHSFQGIHTSRFWEKAEGVSHVSGTNCHPCLGPLTGFSLKYFTRSSRLIVSQTWPAFSDRGNAEGNVLLRIALPALVYPGQLLQNIR